MNDAVKNELLFALYDLQMNEDDAITYVLNQLKSVSYTEAKNAYDEVFETLTY